MQCFYHRDREAIGVCESCRRGLCGECAREVGKSLACAGHCEEDVEIDEARADSAKTIEVLERDKDSLLKFFSVIGVLILSLFVPPAIISGDSENNQLISTGLFFLFGAAVILLYRFLRKRLSQASAGRKR